MLFTHLVEHQQQILAAASKPPSYEHFHNTHRRNLEAWQKELQVCRCRNHFIVRAGCSQLSQWNERMRSILHFYYNIQDGLGRMGTCNPQPGRTQPRALRALIGPAVRGSEKCRIRGPGARKNVHTSGWLVIFMVKFVKNHIKLIQICFWEFAYTRNLPPIKKLFCWYFFENIDRISFHFYINFISNIDFVIHVFEIGVPLHSNRGLSKYKLRACICTCVLHHSTHHICMLDWRKHMRKKGNHKRQLDANKKATMRTRILQRKVLFDCLFFDQ